MLIYTSKLCFFAKFCLVLTKTYIFGQPPRRLSKNASFLQNCVKIWLKMLIYTSKLRFFAKFGLVLEKICILGQPPRRLSENRVCEIYTATYCVLLLDNTLYIVVNF